MNGQSFAGKTAVITGASSGIGRAIAIHLARAGASVFLGGRSQSSLSEAAAAAGAEGGKATPMAGDIRDPRQVQALVGRAMSDTGRLDVMINNAGIDFPGSIVDGDAENWRAMLETNILALLAGSQAAIRAMRACKAEGHIVNISSVAGTREASGVYGATKWAVNAIATTLRKELENDSIRVVNILPGVVATNFARNFPPAFLTNMAQSLGMKIELEPGGKLPPEILDRVASMAKQMIASADDVARAVMYAISQPIELNVFEMIVRPQRHMAILS